MNSAVFDSAGHYEGCEFLNSQVFLVSCFLLWHDKQMLRSLEIK